MLLGVLFYLENLEARRNRMGRRGQDRAAATYVM